MEWIIGCRIGTLLQPVEGRSLSCAISPIGRLERWQRSQSFRSVRTPRKKQRHSELLTINANWTIPLRTATPPDSDTETQMEVVACEELRTVSGRIACCCRTTQTRRPTWGAHRNGEGSPGSNRQARLVDIQCEPGLVHVSPYISQ